MNRPEHLLAILAEECSEVAQRATKAMRFGLSEIQPPQNGGAPGCGSNSQRIIEEWADLCGVMEMLTQEQHLSIPEDFAKMVAHKKSRVETYLEYSRKQGTFQ